MNTERLINIILSELTLDNLKLQEELELGVFSNEKLETKISNLKTLTSRLALNELTITKFQQILINNKIENNTDNNGNV